LIREPVSTPAGILTLIFRVFFDTGSAVASVADISNGLSSSAAGSAGGGHTKESLLYSLLSCPTAIIASLDVTL